MLSLNKLMLLALLLVSFLTLNDAAAVRGTALEKERSSAAAAGSRLLKEDKGDKDDEEEDKDAVEAAEDEGDDEEKEDEEETAEPTKRPKEEKEEEETAEPVEGEEETEEPVEGEVETEEPVEGEEETEEPVEGEEETDEPVEGEEETDEPVEGKEETDGPVEGEEVEASDAPVEGGSEAPEAEETAAPTEAPTQVPIKKGEQFQVELNPFTLYFDSDVLEGTELKMNEYLLSHMSETLDNLVAIDLTFEKTSAEEDMEASAMNVTANETAPEERKLLSNLHRLLAEQALYFTGNATFEGPPRRSEEEVFTALTDAVEDTKALNDHLRDNADDVTFTGGEVEETEEEEEEEEEDPDNTPDGLSRAVQSGSDDDLSVTGLTIVIVAACVGGVSLLIILMVGLTGRGPGGAGLKEDTPEQPRN
jgi:hypothetical protein